ncbi:MAG TPA: hypothetical protein VIL72_13490, partial [Beijerinckiaceae bacterium]
MNAVLRMRTALAERLKALGGPESPEPPPAGDHLVAALTRLGVATSEVAVLRRRLADLTPAHFPCVLVRQDGTGLAVTGRDGAALLVATGSGDRRVPIHALEPHYSGTLLARRDEAAHVGETADGPAPPSRGLFRHILKLTVTDRLTPQMLLAACLGNMFMLALPTYS